MKEVEIKLTEEEYKTFLIFLYFADYCVSSGLVSDFKDTSKKNKVSKIVAEIYRLGDKLDIPKSISLTSLSSEVRFSEEESVKHKLKVESDLDNITHTILAQEFAKKDLIHPSKKYLFDDGYGDSMRQLIVERMQPYLKEFRENGIKNLRFKLFKNPKNKEN